jgi:hypothetical protein
MGALVGVSLIEPLHRQPISLYRFFYLYFLIHFAKNIRSAEEERSVSFAMAGGVEFTWAGELCPSPSPTNPPDLIVIFVDISSSAWNKTMERGGGVDLCEAPLLDLPSTLVAVWWHVAANDDGVRMDRVGMVNGMNK